MVCEPYTIFPSVQQWQKAEDDFDDYFKRKGKRAFVFKFPDAAEIYGRVGKIGQIRAVPSDRIVTCEGETYFAEIKSTERAGPGCLNRISAAISGTSAGFRPPSGMAAG